jgi:Mrp family chromosome partitioning ATPase
MSPLRIQLDRLRRRTWLVIAITILATLGAVAASRGQQSTYTGRATLTIVSTDRAPEQDAPLAQGYAEYFNELSYQQVLAKTAGVPAGVTFSARTAATSPIVYVEATADSPQLAASSASGMAKAFVNDLNENLQSDGEGTIADLRNQLNSERALLDTLQEQSPEAQLATETILSLQNRINDIQTDTSNKLRELQLNAGVSENSPKIAQNAGLGLLGGLILGCVAALAFAGVENRISTAHEVRDQLGLETLAFVPGGRSKTSTRVERLKRLANIVSLSDLQGSATIAITSPRTTPGTAVVAEGLAYYRAIQGERTLLIRANLHQPRSNFRRRDDHPTPVGLADILSGHQRVGLEGKLTQGWCPTMKVLPPGNPQEDPYALFGRDRFAELVQRGADVADLVVIEAPGIIEAAEGQVICAAADRTILVIQEDATRAADAAEACQLLEQVEATLLGVVIVGSHADRGGQVAEQEAQAAPITPGNGFQGTTDHVFDSWAPTAANAAADREHGDRGRS